MKPLIVNDTVADALKGGALAFVGKLETEKSPMTRRGKAVGSIEYRKDLPYQIGDKVFLPEDCFFDDEWDCVRYLTTDDGDDMIYTYKDRLIEIKKENMTFDQARHKWIISDIKIVRVKDITNGDCINMNLYTYEDMEYEYTNTTEFFNFATKELREYLKVQNINYNSNEYIPLYTLELIKE